MRLLNYRNLKNIQKLESGQTIHRCISSGYVSKKERHLNLFNLFKTDIIDKMKQHYPVIVMTFTCVICDFYYQLFIINFIKQGFNQTMVWSFFVMLYLTMSIFLEQIFILIFGLIFHYFSLDTSKVFLKFKLRKLGDNEGMMLFAILKIGDVFSTNQIFAKTLCSNLIEAGLLYRTSTTGSRASGHTEYKVSEGVVDRLKTSPCMKILYNKFKDSKFSVNTKGELIFKEEQSNN